MDTKKIARELSKCNDAELADVLETIGKILKKRSERAGKDSGYTEYAVEFYKNEDYYGQEDVFADLNDEIKYIANAPATDKDEQYVIPSITYEDGQKVGTEIIPYTLERENLLRPCPFCGGIAEFADYGKPGEFEDWNAICKGCGTLLNVPGREEGWVTDKEEAAASWNERTTKIKKKSSNGLKPCPFCNGTADFVSYGDTEEDWNIECSCGRFFVFGAYDSENTCSKDRAAEFWNRRV